MENRLTKKMVRLKLEKRLTKNLNCSNYKDQLMATDQKDGVSVREIENFAKNNRFKLFLCLAFLLACFFSFVFFTAWSIILGAVGGIIGVLLPAKVASFSKKTKDFCEKQESTTQLILGCVVLVLSVFLPPLIYLVLGAAGGKQLEGLR
jgi:hypothetical protein